MKGTVNTSQRLALVAAHAMDAKRADDIVILDIGRFTTLADYFIIASGDTSLQIRAIVEAVEDAMEAEGAPLVHREGDEHARWVLLDFGPVVAHIFGTEARRFYQLEGLWADAPILEH